MHLGTFDDRNDARLAVKHWLDRHSVHDYTPDNMRRLAREIVKSDGDPVDTVEATWRETSYGIVRGIVEFAADEMEHCHRSAPAAISPASLRDVATALRHAVSSLPAHPYRAAVRLRDAVAAYEDVCARSAADRGSSSERPMTALHLALALLGRMPCRVASPVAA